MVTLSPAEHQLQAGSETDMIAHRTTVVDKATHHPLFLNTLKVGRTADANVFVMATGRHFRERSQLQADNSVGPGHAPSSQLAWLQALYWRITSASIHVIL